MKVYFPLPDYPKTTSVLAFVFSYYESFSLYEYNLRPFFVYMNLDPVKGKEGLKGINFRISL